MLETAQPSGGAATRQSAAQAEQYKVDPHSQVRRQDGTPPGLRGEVAQGVRSKIAAMPWPPPMHIVSRA
jgi:hypothetical protein